MSLLPLANPKASPIPGDYVLMIDSLDGQQLTRYCRALDLVNGANQGLALAASASPVMDCSQSNVFILTPAQAESISAINFKSGQNVFLIILTSGSTSYTLTFSSGIRSAGTLATGTVTAKYWVVEFNSDGTNLIEVGRSPAAI